MSSQGSTSRLGGHGAYGSQATRTIKPYEVDSKQDIQEFYRNDARGATYVQDRFGTPVTRALHEAEMAIVNDLLAVGRASEDPGDRHGSG